MSFVGYLFRQTLANMNFYISIHRHSAQFEISDGPDRRLLSYTSIRSVRLSLLNITFSIQVRATNLARRNITRLCATPGNRNESTEVGWSRDGNRWKLTFSHTESTGIATSPFQHSRDFWCMKSSVCSIYQFRLDKYFFSVNNIRTNSIHSLFKSPAVCYHVIRGEPPAL